jgi:K+-transporting ATPase KdpF subunit
LDLQLVARGNAVIYAIAAVGAVALLGYLTVSLLKPEWF